MLHTYRARSLQAALRLVREELGPDASVLHTREVSAGWRGWIGAAKEIEVTASADVQVASRFGPAEPLQTYDEPFQNACTSFQATEFVHSTTGLPPADLQDFRSQFRADLRYSQPAVLSPLEELCEPLPATNREFERVLEQLRGELAEARIPAAIADEWLVELAGSAVAQSSVDATFLKQHLARLVQAEISIGGPIQVTAAERRLVALVGPTGVGKTTTIAKLAANFRLRQRRKVGLITVDTYRIAAVDQLRTYADIMDLPMEVVATPREMRAAVDRFAEFDLVLLDTAGRSPRDEVRIQELRAMLAEADADEVHLVLSAAAGLESLQAAVNSFARVGATSLVLTKLDEATHIGNLLPLLRDSRLPLSYTTDGQNVPDDICPADRRRLAQIMLGEVERVH